MVHTMLLAGNYIPVRGPLFQQSSSLHHQGIHCDVVFGSPSADCRGTGICKITGTNGISTLNFQKECRRTQAVLVERADNQGITLIFFRSRLCSQLYRRHFWKGVFTVDETCILPKEIQNALTISYGQILPGQYEVREVSGCFQIDLMCAI